MYRYKSYALLRVTKLEQTNLSNSYNPNPGEVNSTEIAKEGEAKTRNYNDGMKAIEPFPAGNSAVDHL